MGITNVSLGILVLLVLHNYIWPALNSLVLVRHCGCRHSRELPGYLFLRILSRVRLQKQRGTKRFNKEMEREARLSRLWVHVCNVASPLSGIATMADLSPCYQI